MNENEIARHVVDAAYKIHTLWQANPVQVVEIGYTALRKLLA